MSFISSFSEELLFCHKSASTDLVAAGVQRLIIKHTARFPKIIEHTARFLKSTGCLSVIECGYLAKLLYPSLYSPP